MTVEREVFEFTFARCIIYFHGNTSRYTLKWYVNTALFFPSLKFFRFSFFRSRCQCACLPPVQRTKIKFVIVCWNVLQIFSRWACYFVIKTSVYVCAVSFALHVYDIGDNRFLRLLSFDLCSSGVQAFFFASPALVLFMCALELLFTIFSAIFPLRLHVIEPFLRRLMTKRYGWMEQDPLRVERT